MEVSTLRNPKKNIPPLLVSDLISGIAQTPASSLIALK
jgi:hypothetical protein